MAGLRGAPEEHVSSVVRPDDFDAFWEALLAEAAAIPLNPLLQRMPWRCTPEVDVYEIRYDSLDGVRVAGWYCRPTPAYLPPPYPALLLVPGYISEPTLPKSWARQGYAAVGVAPRGKLRSNRQFNPGYPGLLLSNAVDRNTYAYRGFYIDACRAVDFVQSRPEVNPSRIGVHGSSQGGALTIITAALRRDAITCGAAGAPYLCGMMDAAALTHSYPYEEINDYLRLHPEREPQLRATLNYFDGINFAPRITCPMLVHIGLEDDVCPPETGYAAYRAMTCPKELHPYPRCAHDAGAHWESRRVAAFLAQQLRPATLTTAEPRGSNAAAVDARWGIHRAASASRAELQRTVESDTGQPQGSVAADEPPGAKQAALERVDQQAAPPDFTAFWRAVDDDLAALPAAPELDVLPLRSTAFCTVYALRLTSIGPYRIFGYYSVPHGDGPFPALLHLPRYGSVNHVPPYADRQRYVALTLMHRGQRLADTPFAAAYPGLLTQGIDDPRRYIYRGIVADCLRGAEFLLARPEVAPGRVGVTGGDLAPLTAARRPGFTAMVASGFQFYRTMEARQKSDAYPLEEINDYLRAAPQQEAAVARCLAYYDPVNHAPGVAAATLLPVGGADDIWLESLAAALGGPVERYALTHEGATDHRALDAWLAGTLGAPTERQLEGMD